MQWDLRDGEELLWTGRPRSTLAVRSNDIYWIPIGLLFTGFVIFWLRGVLSIDAAIAPGVVIFVGVGYLFLGIGLYMLIGRFLVDAWVRHRTRYALTTDRVLIRSWPFMKDKRTELQLASLPTIEWTERWDKSGTITLAQPREPAWNAQFHHVPFLPTIKLADHWAGFHLPIIDKHMPKQFDRIDDVSVVYRRVLRAQHEARLRHPELVPNKPRRHRTRRFDD